MLLHKGALHHLFTEAAKREGGAPALLFALSLFLHFTVVLG